MRIPVVPHELKENVTDYDTANTLRLFACLRQSIKRSQVCACLKVSSKCTIGSLHYYNYNRLFLQSEDKLPSKEKKKFNSKVPRAECCSANCCQSLLQVVVCHIQEDRYSVSDLPSRSSEIIISILSVFIAQVYINFLTLKYNKQIIQQHKKVILS